MSRMGTTDSMLFSDIRPVVLEGYGSRHISASDTGLYSVTLYVLKESYNNVHYINTRAAQYA